MQAMLLEKIGQPLVLKDVPCPEPQPHEYLIKVNTCGVCRTDLHIVDGELPHPKFPLIPGHQIVGTIEKAGPKATKYKIGDRVGVPWLCGSCHKCEYCTSGRENLCDKATYTGYLHNGGYAEFCAVHEDYILKIPSKYNDIQAAPLLCAGLIGFRAYRLAGDIKSIGLYGFGSSAHILAQIAHAQGKEVYVFTRPGDAKTQKFALSLGAKWAGGSDELPSKPLDAALIFAPIGALFPQALKAVKKGGRVISAGIHMSDIPSFPYSLLWEERAMSSVANLTRQDGWDFMEIADSIPLKISVTEFPLKEANAALAAIRNGTLEGSAVLKIKPHGNSAA